MFLGPVPETPQKLLEPMNTTAYWKDGKLEMPVNRARTRWEIRDETGGLSFRMVGYTAMRNGHIRKHKPT
jgi:hypothetical protein